ncbi:DUF2127 domain-containing protein [Microbacterium sp. LTA6]|uniref:DUF2127 domain-containing protein n=1 Tax=Microbacterium sp. LTA6 TaxID=3129771 RepID=UPI003245CCF7
MPESPDHTLLDRVFDVSITLKGIVGIAELVGGFALFFVNPEMIRQSLGWLTAHLLVGHDHSPIAMWFDHLADNLGTDATIFAAVYLILHGVIKVVLVWALLKQQLWAYPWMIVALVVFIIYQVYEILVHFTWAMVVLTLFDLFIVALTLREWQLHRESHAATRAAAPA